MDIPRKGVAQFDLGPVNIQTNGNEIFRLFGCDNEIVARDMRWQCLLFARSSLSWIHDGIAEVLLVGSGITKTFISHAEDGPGIMFSSRSQRLIEGKLLFLLLYNLGVAHLICQKTLVLILVFDILLCLDAIDGCLALALSVGQGDGVLRFRCGFGRGDFDA